MADTTKVNFALQDESVERLDKLCEMDFRGKSNMIDWLIDQEWSRRFHSPSPVTIEEAEAVAQ